MEKQNIPEGSVLRDDGCICPAPPPPKKCSGIKVCPYDPRFPNTNQTYHCFLSFIDYQRCTRLLGDYPGCEIFYICYTQLCPVSWVNKWFEQMEKGTFPRKIYPPKPIVYPGTFTYPCQDEEEPEPQENPVC